MIDLVFFEHGNYYVGDFANCKVPENNKVIAKFKIEGIPEGKKPILVDGKLKWVKDEINN